MSAEGRIGGEELNGSCHADWSFLPPVCSRAEGELSSVTTASGWV